MAEGTPGVQCGISPAQATADTQMFIYLHLKTFGGGDTAVSPQEMCPGAYSISIRKCFLTSDSGALCCSPRLLLLRLEGSLIPFSLPNFHVFDETSVSELCAPHTLLWFHQQSCICSLIRESLQHLHFRSQVHHFS